MAFVAYNDMLNPQFVLELVRRQYAPSAKMLQMFGLEPGNGKLHKSPVRSYQYDILDSVRNPGYLSAPGTEADEINPQYVSTTSVTIARLYQKLRLPAEKIRNQRPYGESPGQLAVPADVIEAQTKIMADMASTFRTTILFGMLRDSLYYTRSANKNYLTFSSVSSGSVNIPFQVPAGNKGQLNMLGNGNIITESWDDPNADIFNQIGQINAAFDTLHGLPLANGIITFKTWGYLTNNTGLRNRAGAVNMPFREFQHEIGTDYLGRPINQFTGILAALPWMKWTVMDTTVNLGAPGSETVTKLVDENHAIFLPEMDGTWYQGCEGTEDVTEFIGRSPAPRTGLYSYSVPFADPTGYMMYVGDNFIVVPKIPKAIAYGEVVFAS